MRDIPASMAAAFASGVTTHCRCWKVMRADGAVFGFTDHDRDLAFDSVVFRAATGLEAYEAEHSLGLAVGGGELAGALMADTIREDDIAAGLWDNAAVESWLVDWQDLASRVLLDTGNLGEIRRDGARFTAEVRSLAHQLDQTKGRRYESLCDATLGDDRCTVNLTGSTRRADVIVSAVPDPQSFTCSAAPGFAASAFTLGKARFLTGVNAGLEVPILGATRSGTVDRITLWSAPRHPLVPGTQIRLTVGCDKRFETCRDRFANALNFRGFPHIPGNDFVVGYARQGEPNQDGDPVVP